MDIDDLKIYIKDPLQLEDFQTIQNEAEDMIKFGDPEECKDLANYIGGILQEYAPQLQNQPQLYDFYQAYWHRLAFKAFINLPANVRNDLIQRRLLFAVSKGFEPDHLIRKYFEVLVEPQTVRSTLSNLLKPLQDNSETLGSNPLMIEDKKYLPQLKNWILDYSKSPSLNARRGSIDRLNYINQNSNVRGLTQNQRQVLLKVLKFYDDLLNPELTSIAQAAEQPVFAEQPRPAQVRQAAAPAPAAIPASAPAAAPLQTRPPQNSFSAGPATDQAPPKIDINQKLEELKNRKK